MPRRPNNSLFPRWSHKADEEAVNFENRPVEKVESEDFDKETFKNYLDEYIGAKRVNCCARTWGKTVQKAWKKSKASATARAKKPYWWSQKVESLRKARNKLNKKIRLEKRLAWESLCRELDEVVFDQAYQITCKKLHLTGPFYKMSDNFRARGCTPSPLHTGGAIKEVALHSPQVSRRLMSELLVMQTIPTEWKKTKLVLIHKSGKPVDMSGA
ncbi:hypothetical protein ABEB36_015035 [Hypothenemus hampei]|uniref:Uncharacterized protein n=1 Tax=Hypothenemus hampei TaxID=57062 RepID=A0ABD1E1N5_HYPHA